MIVRDCTTVSEGMCLLLGHIHISATNTKRVDRETISIERENPTSELKINVVFPPRVCSCVFILVRLR